MDDCLERTQSMVAMTELKPSEEEEEGQQVHEPNGGGDGLINQLISHLPTFGSNANGELNNDSTTVAAGPETKQDENSGGGGLIDQIVVNLPSVSAPLSIPDDPAPDPEEASLLIHIIQD